MDSSQARQFLTQVELLHDREFNKDSLSIIFKNLESVPVEVGISIVKQMERAVPSDGKRSYLPAPKDLIHIVQLEKARMYPTADPSVAKMGNLPARDKTSLSFRMFVKIKDRMFDGRTTRAQILEMIKLADNSAPHDGWAVEGSRLAGFYSRRGLDLDKPPTGAIFDF